MVMGDATLPRRPIFANVDAPSSPTRLTVAVALTQPPLAEGGAPGKCAIGLLRGLEAHGLDVRAIAARQSFALPGEPPADLPVEIVPAPPEPPGLRTHARAYLRPRGELGRGPFAERFREVAAAADVAHLEETETAPAGQRLATPSVVHVHYLARRDRDLGPPWRRQFREVGLFALSERNALRGGHHLVASSPVVADALRTATGREVVVAPLSLDPSLYPRAPLDGPPVAGIIGTASWPGTASALRRLARVWPLIRREVPDARLAIAGRGTERLSELGELPGVELQGEVESATEWLGHLSVLLFPIDRGSGVKVKVLEAIASGIPVVTTSHGAEGIDADGGVVVADDDAGLARAAAAILRDEAERRERGAAAHAAFVARYAPAPATAPLVELYRRIARQRT
jgi:glycosyltransferase involved in cell wall biosynthesis